VEWFEPVSRIAQASSPVLLVLAVWAFAVGRVVPRWVYEESSKRESAWQLLYEREKATAERLLDEQERRREQPV
jgi:hypothetical protein